MPGSSPSLRHTSSYFAACAVSSVHVGRRPHAARVGHRRPEHHPVEVVRHVVVVCDGRGVALLRVPAAVQPRLLGRRRQRPQTRRCPATLRELEPFARRRCCTSGRLCAQLERVEDVALHVELAGHVRARDADLARRGEHVPQRVGRSDDERGVGVVGADAAAVVALDRDRRVRRRGIGRVPRPSRRRSVNRTRRRGFRGVGSPTKRCPVRAGTGVACWSSCMAHPSPRPTPTSGASVERIPNTTGRNARCKRVRAARRQFGESTNARDRCCARSPSTPWPSPPKVVISGASS